MINQLTIIKSMLDTYTTYLVAIGLFLLGISMVINTYFVVKRQMIKIRVLEKMQKKEAEEKPKTRKPRAKKQES